MCSGGQSGAAARRVALPPPPPPLLPPLLLPPPLRLSAVTCCCVWPRLLERADTLLACPAPAGSWSGCAQSPLPSRQTGPNTSRPAAMPLPRPCPYPPRPPGCVLQWMWACPSCRCTPSERCAPCRTWAPATAPSFLSSATSARSMPRWTPTPCPRWVLAGWRVQGLCWSPGEPNEPGLVGTGPVGGEWWMEQA